MQNTFNYNGVTIAYTVTGTGQPVVLLHGFAEDSSVWNEQVDFLKDTCQLIVPDLPGSGKSAMLQSENGTMEDYATCIKALLGHQGIESCIMLGHSMGGYITLAFAEMFPAQLTGFGFVHSTAFADNEEKKTTRKKSIKFIEEHGAYTFIKSTTPNLFSASFKRQQPNEVEALIEQGKSFSEEALVQYYTAMMNRPDRTAVLKKSEVPVLFIMGTEDVAAPVEDLLKQVHLPKVSYMHILEDTGHMSMLEKPTILNQHLLDYITDITER